MSGGKQNPDMSGYSSVAGHLNWIPSTADRRREKKKQILRLLKKKKKEKREHLASRR
jgi:hypothetical protein